MVAYHDLRSALLDEEVEAVHLVDALGAVESLAGPGQEEEETKLEHDATGEERREEKTACLSVSALRRYISGNYKGQPYLYLYRVHYSTVLLLIF